MINIEDIIRQLHELQVYAEMREETVRELYELIKQRCRTCIHHSLVGKTDSCDVDPVGRYMVVKPCLTVRIEGPCFIHATLYKGKGKKKV